VTYLDFLPNPFLPHPVAGTAAPVTVAPRPAAGAAAYDCCPDCGTRAPCDQYCPLPGPTPLAIDEAAFMAEIEPVPPFLTREQQADAIEELLEHARPEEWPAPPRRMRA
jgi:hypothetical protein